MIKTISYKFCALVLLVCFQANAVLLSDYCQENVVCSDNFMSALNGAMKTKTPLIVTGSNYLVKDISTAGKGFSNITIIGVGDARLKTNQLHFADIPFLTIKNLKIEGIDYYEGSEEQDTSLVFVGTKKSTLVDNVTFDNVTISKAAEDLLAIWNVNNLVVTNNTLMEAGLAMRIAPILVPNDLRPRGSAFAIKNIKNANFSSNTVLAAKKVGIYFASENFVSNNIVLSNNFIDLKSDSQPTQRYGLLGGNGIYFDQTTNFEKVDIFGNNIRNYNTSALRINGSGFNVFDNQMNSSENCSPQGQYVEPSIGASGIKSHYLKNSFIYSNCVENSLSGVSLESWGVISNVTISTNTIYNSNSSIVVQYKSGGTYNHINIHDNQIYGALQNAIALRSDHIVSNNSVQRNTIISNMNWDGTDRRKGPLVYFQNQSDFKIKLNYLVTTAYSKNWTHVLFNGSKNGIFERNIVMSGTGDDYRLGGVTLYSNTSGIEVSNNDFYSLSPGIINESKSNTIGQNSYN